MMYIGVTELIFTRIRRRLQENIFVVAYNCFNTIINDKILQKIFFFSCFFFWTLFLTYLFDLHSTYN